MSAALVYYPARPDFQDRAVELHRVLRDEHPVHPSDSIWARAHPEMRVSFEPG